MRADEILGGNVKMKVKRIIAGLLAMVMLLTATLPTSNVKAASGTASLDSLGKLGTVNVGSKSESGIWLQTLVNEKPVFCMDLGLACHTGYTYISKTKTLCIYPSLITFILAYGIPISNFSFQSIFFI